MVPAAECLAKKNKNKGGKLGGAVTGAIGQSNSFLSTPPIRLFSFPQHHP
jgi:hypothetical protein